jgi:hypothetical protein
MTIKLLSPHELRVWHAFMLMGEDVLGRVGRDIAPATGLSGPEFGVLSRLAALGKDEMRCGNKRWPAQWPGMVSNLLGEED